MAMGLIHHLSHRRKDEMSSVSVMIEVIPYNTNADNRLSVVVGV